MENAGHFTIFMLLSNNPKPHKGRKKKRKEKAMNFFVYRRNYWDWI